MASAIFRAFLPMASALCWKGLGSEDRLLVPPLMMCVLENCILDSLPWVLPILNT